MAETKPVLCPGCGRMTMHPIMSAELSYPLLYSCGCGRQMTPDAYSEWAAERAPQRKPSLRERMMTVVRRG